MRRIDKYKDKLFSGTNTYADRQKRWIKKNNVMVGSKVMLRQCILKLYFARYPNGYPGSITYSQRAMYNKNPKMVYEILQINNNDIRLSSGYGFPYFALRLIKT